MAEETQTDATPEPASSLSEEVLVSEVPEAPTEKEVLKVQPPPQVEKEHKRSDLESALAAEKAAEEEEKKIAEEEEKKASNVLKAAVSFKEESNLVGDLQERERKALDEFKQLIQAAIANNEFSPPPQPQPSASAPADASAEEPKEEEAIRQPPEDVKAEETPEPQVEETKAEDASKVPVEETVPTAEETSKQAAEEEKLEEEDSKPSAEGAKPEEEASKAVIEEVKHEVEVSKPAAEGAEPEEEEASKPAAEEAKVDEDAPVIAALDTKVEEEPLKPTAEDIAPPSEEAKVATPSPPSVEAEAKSVVADDDDAKTVEAIEETVVPVAAAAPPPADTTPPEAEAPAKEEEKEKPSSEAPAVAAEPPEEISIWGVLLLGDDRSDTILLKFLRARDFKVKEAMTMLKNAVLWRKEFGIEALLAEDLGVPELEKVVFMHGADREGHPVCYNVYGELQNKELYTIAFANEEKRRRFLRWRIQFLERGIRDLLDLSPGGVSSMVQVTDLKNSIWLAKKELRQALDLLQDNYPEFSAKQIFINVPWWYLAFNRMISPFFTQRTKSKFVFAGPSRSAETLFKYIAPEQVPVQYGGLSKENDPEFTTADAVTEINIKPSTKQNIEIPVSEACLPFWELRVLGWDVTVGAEFVPRAEDGYTIIVQKARKLSPSDEPVVQGSYKVGEAGKVILTVDNTTSKKKKLLYRYKIKTSTESA